MKNKTSQPTTAGDVLANQHSRIMEAIELLQGSLNAMTDLIDPETATWRDVLRFAHIADIADKVIERYES